MNVSPPTAFKAVICRPVVGGPFVARGTETATLVEDDPSKEEYLGDVREVVAGGFRVCKDSRLRASCLPREPNEHRVLIVFEQITQALKKR